MEVAQMEMALHAIETTATLDENGQLILDELLTIALPRKVRVILLIPDIAEPADPTEKEWLQAAAKNPVFAYLRENAEDLYTISDGVPFKDQL